MGLSHKKIYFIGLIVGVLLTLLSLLLGPLGFQEEKRLSINFGLAGVQMGAVFLAILSGASLLKEELDNQIAYIFLSKDVTRSQYLLSKFFGFFFSLLVTLAILGGFFLLTSFLTGLDWSFKILIPFTGILIEALILFSFALLISLITSSLLTVGLTFCFFLVAHWIGTLEYLLEKSFLGGGAKFMGSIVLWIVPNLEGFNWKAHLTYKEWSEPSVYFFSSFYGLCWITVFLSAAIIVFNRKDLT